MNLSSKKDLTNKYMHLTNNAIQELGKNYSIHEKGNIISIPRMEEILKEEGNPLDFEKVIWPQICEGIRISALSCAHLLNPNKRRHCFEVFGYDFMIDRRLKTWLIEINTNPSLSESNDTVKTIIERMFGKLALTLDDAFKITIDKIFWPKKSAQVPNNSNKSPEANQHPRPESTIKEMSKATDNTRMPYSEYVVSEREQNFAADSKNVSKADKTPLRSSVKSSQSANKGFRISLTTKTSLDSGIKTRELLSSDKTPSSKRTIAPSKATTHTAVPITENEKEHAMEQDYILEGNLNRESNDDRVFYKTPSQFPLSYKDNYMNLW